MSICIFSALSSNFYSSSLSSTFSTSEASYITILGDFIFRDSFSMTGLSFDFFYSSMFRDYIAIISVFILTVERISLMSCFMALDFSFLVSCFFLSKARAIN